MPNQIQTHFEWSIPGISSNKCGSQFSENPDVLLARVLPVVLCFNLIIWHCADTNQFKRQSVSHLRGRRGERVLNDSPFRLTHIHYSRSIRVSFSLLSATGTCARCALQNDNGIHALSRDARYSLVAPIPGVFKTSFFPHRTIIIKLARIQPHTNRLAFEGYRKQPRARGAPPTVMGITGWSSRFRGSSPLPFSLVPPFPSAAALQTRAPTPSAIIEAARVHTRLVQAPLVHPSPFLPSRVMAS